MPRPQQKPSPRRQQQERYSRNSKCNNTGIASQLSSTTVVCLSMLGSTSALPLQGLWKALASSKIKHEGLNLNEDPMPTGLSITANGVPLPPLSEKSIQNTCM